uniref:hypothetical protein n=1 Tax=Candidatus Ichthyocystis hellenicum TaxID=1561003 RepID=UPI001F5FBEED
VERSRGMGQVMVTMTREELDSGLAALRAQEQSLSAELGGVITHAMSLEEKIYACGSMLSGETEVELKARMDGLKALTKSKALAKIRELELRIELSRVRSRIVELSMDVERLRDRYQN